MLNKQNNTLAFKSDKHRYVVLLDFVNSVLTAEENNTILSSRTILYFQAVAIATTGTQTAREKLTAVRRRGSSHDDTSSSYSKARHQAWRSTTRFCVWAEEEDVCDSTLCFSFSPLNNRKVIHFNRAGGYFTL